jgi:GTPase SAR1 family protein
LLSSKKIEGATTKKKEQERKEKMKTTWTPPPPQPQQPVQAQQQPKQQRIKCVVLGAADAGKTSLLRRYFRDTFHCDRTPTMGSDFYTLQTSLPIRSNNNSSRSTTTKIQKLSAVEKVEQMQQNSQNGGTENTAIVENHQYTNGDTNFEQNNTSHKKKKNQSDQQQPENGIFHTRKEMEEQNNPHFHLNQEKEKVHSTTATTTTVIPILFQMWDTPGRERLHQRNQKLQEEQQEQYIESLIDAFCGRVDGVMLVYDMTSSTSFTQLRLWHAHWRKKASTDVPILIVGNKRDLIPPMTMHQKPYNNRSKSKQKHANKKQQQLQPPKTSSSSSSRSKGAASSTTTHNTTTTTIMTIPEVPPRDVMGLEGSFRGNDFRYEYRVHHDVAGATTATTATSSSSNTPTRQQQQQQQQQRRQRRNHKHEISTFQSTAGSYWTEDGTYLDSLLSTEDGSNPDRDMVKLWYVPLQQSPSRCLTYSQRTSLNM